MELLIQQMLETARLEDNRIELRRELFDLGPLAEEQLRAFRPLVAGHQLVLERSPRPALVSADRSRIATVMVNAIKYSPAGGEIRCTVGTQDGRAFVTVRDQGVGIDAEHMKLLFTRFTRLPTERNVTIPGTGLGLYLCREIARRHGGDIDVESRPGSGSTFTLTLPAAVAHSVAATAG